ncbi:hypothetical protein ACUHMQ_20255, partial [Chitinimonas sp. PSY-7]|uniref:hypothetical protein n=1 Tax=Chitinimonas sp. PSY-7 TaxID=3459088 RepID=UPI00403FEDBE
MALPRTLDQIRSQNPQLDQLDDHTIMVAIYNRDFADKMTPQQYMEATGYKPSASTMDYVKSAAAGAGDLVAAAGYGVEKLGADRVGGAIRDAGQTAQRYWVDDMTGAGRSVANNPIVTDDYALGDTPLQSTLMAASRSVPGMLATAPVGGVVGLAAKSGLGRLAVAKGAQAAAEAGTTTLAQKALLAAPGAIGMGVAEGGQAALVNAEQTHAKVMDLAATPEDVLLQNPTYRATLQQTRDPLAARKAVADETANQVLRNTMVSTGGIGILTGGGALGSVFNRVTGQAGTSLAGAGLGGMAKAMAKDIGKEAGQEFLQSGAEQYIQNAAERDHLDPSKDAWRGVGPAALSGAAVGGLLGGGTHVLGKPFEARRATAPTEPPVTDMANLPAIYRPGGEYIPANEPAPSQQQPEAPPAAKYNVTPDGVAIPVAPEVRALPDKSGTLYANQYGVASDQLADVAPNEQMAKELDAQTRRRDGALRVIGKIQQRASELDGEALAQFQANSAPALARAQQAWQESDAVIAELRHGNDADKQESAAEPVRAATVAEQPGPTPSIERSVPEVQEQAPEAATPPSPKGKSSSRTKADKQDQQTAMLSDEALSERESYIADQAKRNGGWNTMLAAGMREVRNEQTKRAKAARHDDLFKAEDKVANDVPQQVEQAKPVEKPVKWFTTAERATTYIDKKKLTDTHEAVAVERLAPNGKHVTVHEIHPKSVKSVKKGAEPVPAKKDAAEASALEVVEPKQATNADTPPSPAIPSKVESQEEESHSSKSDDDAPSAQVAEQIPLRSTPPETPSQTEKKKAARKATAPTTAKPHLEDVGDALRWNRKGIFRNGGLTWDAIKDENDTLKVKLASKEKIWARPNWEAIIEAVPEDQREGFTVIAHLVKQVYDALPKQSTNVSDKALQTYIDVVGELRESANTLLNNKERQGALWVELGKRAQKVGLLSHSDYFDYLIPAKRDASIMPLFAELFPKQAAGERFSRGTPENDRAMALGRKAVSAMQWNTSSAKDALLAIKDGWPAKQAAWQKQGYRIISAGDITSEIHQLRSGRHAAYLPLDATTNEYVGSFETEKTAQAAADELLAKRANRFLLLNKRKTVLGDYASEAEALNAAKSQTARKTETEPDKDVAPNDGGWERKGVDRRNPGENITPERLEQTFNFRGVNFGNWVSQEERQQHVNAAFDALHDLATAMGIPPAAMGLGGKLGLAFGAQGNGGRNAAHFVPGVNEINITRTSGAGALA